MYYHRSIPELFQETFYNFLKDFIIIYAMYLLALHCIYYPLFCKFIKNL